MKTLFCHSDPKMVAVIVLWGYIAFDIIDM